MWDWTRKEDLTGHGSSSRRNDGKRRNYLLLRQRLRGRIKQFQEPIVKGSDHVEDQHKHGRGEAKSSPCSHWSVQFVTPQLFSPPCSHHALGSSPRDGWHLARLATEKIPEFIKKKNLNASSRVPYDLQLLKGVHHLTRPAKTWCTWPSMMRMTGVVDGLPILAR